MFGIMEKKMETIIVYWGFFGDNGKEHGNLKNEPLLKVKANTEHWGL